MGSSKPKPNESLAVLFPGIAAQAVGWDPKEVSSGSSRKLRWRCELGHEWDAVVASRVNGHGCAVCANKLVSKGFNDLATTHPELAAQAVGWNPETVSAGTHAELLWRCELGHEWTAEVRSRVRGRGCPICSGNKILVGFNDLATTHPELAAQAVGWNPKQVSLGSNRKLLWSCELGHEWHSSVANRTASRQTGCSVCAGKEVLVGFNDLATTHPELASQAVGWNPKTVIAGTSKKLRWRCELGHEWDANVASRALSNRGCPVCAGQKILVGFNDLATTHPELASQAVGWNPKTVIAGTHKKLRWRCELGHEWSSEVKGRVDGRGCPSCSEGGFDPNLDSWLYFLEHDEWQMFQIGITNYPEDRLARHTGIGWTVLEIRGAMDGSLTRNLETAILRSLKRRGAMFANKTGGRKFDGWSESWSKLSVNVSGLKDLLNFVHEDDALVKP